MAGNASASQLHHVTLDGREIELHVRVNRRARRIILRYNPVERHLMLTLPRSAVPSAVRAPAMGAPVFRSTTSPKALAAIRAPTVTPLRWTLALPMPPFMAWAMPNSLPTVAPAPGGQPFCELARRDAGAGPDAAL